MKGKPGPAGLRTSRVVVVNGVDVTGVPVGVVPLAVAWLTTTPASASATATPVRVVLPEFVTR
ncbi:hypothetical protein [Candidatus Frankia alpina]|uniref:hypothetical protein n=1 Tax=Candidatus Frankia alpina TaxID=2699483 RepID=UPI001387199B|nr:hypothetical protein [Candidatus Frankia alpina]